MVNHSLIYDNRFSSNNAKQLRQRPLVEALLLILGAGPLSAATITVNSTADGTLPSLVNNGTCDLREAIAAANTNSAVGNCPSGTGLDTITLATGPTITLTTGQLTISSNITFQGQGTTIDGNNSARVLTIGNSATATLTSLTVQNGNAVFGGGIYVRNATTNLINSTVSDNTAVGGAVVDGKGGGVYARYAVVNLTNSTVSGNNAVNRRGGGIYARDATISLNNSTVSGNTANFFGGGIYARDGVVSLINSTISGNTAVAFGGGIGVTMITLNLTNSTISGNTALGSAGGLYIRYSTVSLANSILANNAAVSMGPDLSGFAGGVVTTNFSLIGTNAGISSLIINQGPGSQIGSPGPINPLLGPLQNNGGPTETHALLLGSPAINAGNNALAKILVATHSAPISEAQAFLALSPPLTWEL